MVVTQNTVDFLGNLIANYLDIIIYERIN
jgi:hypothetical protein